MSSNRFRTSSISSHDLQSVLKWNLRFFAHRYNTAPTVFRPKVWAFAWTILLMLRTSFTTTLLSILSLMSRTPFSDMAIVSKNSSKILLSGIALASICGISSTLTGYFGIIFEGSAGLMSNLQTSAPASSHWISVTIHFVSNANSSIRAVIPAKSWWMGEGYVPVIFGKFFRLSEPVLVSSVNWKSETFPHPKSAIIPKKYRTLSTPLKPMSSASRAIKSALNWLR